MTQVPAAVQAIFARSQDELGRRVRTLEEAVPALLEGQLDESLRAKAERDAHKLAGSLGMFGLPRGSELAREIEEVLGVPDGPVPAAAPRLAELVLALRGQLEDALVGSRDHSHAGSPLPDVARCCS